MAQESLLDLVEKILTEEQISPLASTSTRKAKTRSVFYHKNEHTSDENRRPLPQQQQAAHIPTPHARSR